MQTSNSSFELQVLVEGRPIREYGHQGRTYIEGRKSNKFTLKFKNNTPNRILAIPSVDGICACDGQPATSESKGYVVPGYSSVEIKGWRKSLEDSADFVFTDKSGAYAAHVAGDQNTGVLAVRVISEKLPPQPTFVWPKVEEHHHHHHHYPAPVWPRRPFSPWYDYPDIICGDGITFRSTSAAPNNLESGTRYASALSGQMMCCANNMATSSLAAAEDAPEFKLATGWGDLKKDVVTEVAFERGNELATLCVYYSDEASLRAIGLSLSKDPVISRPVPQAFSGFCVPPKRS